MTSASVFQTMSEESLMAVYIVCGAFLLSLTLFLGLLLYGINKILDLRDITQTDLYNKEFKHKNIQKK